MEYKPEVSKLLEAAERLAGRLQQPVTSVHLLLSLFGFENSASLLLAEHAIGEDRLIGPAGRFNAEEAGVVAGLLADAAELVDPQVNGVTCLHLLAAMLRGESSGAARLMAHAGVDLHFLRNRAMSYVTGGMPVQYRRASERAWALEGGGSATPLPRPARPSPPGAGPAADSPPRPTPAAVAKPAAAAPGRFDLDPERCPVLAACGINLVRLAAEGRLDRVIGREREIQSLLDVLNKRRANNPCLIGEPGVGKTAVVEGLAALYAERIRDGGPERRLIVRLDPSALTAGTERRGALEERVRQVRGEVARSNGEVVVFLDEIHAVLGSGEPGREAAQELKGALARGEFPCIGATTYREYREQIEADPALARRFTPVEVVEPPPETALEIVRGVAGEYEKHHAVAYTDAALQAAVRLSHRHVSDRFLPDKAINLLDLAGSKKRRDPGAAEKVVDERDIARVIAGLTGIPATHLLMDDRVRFLRLEEALGREVIGHRQIIGRICSLVRRNHAGFRDNRPVGSFLFLGPTGVGKTEIARIVARHLFDGEDRMVRFDMGEFMEPHAVSRLIGAPPGYVGYGRGGELTEAVRRRPYALVLFDEVEKAHPEVLNVLLRLLDEGVLHDAEGRTVNFRETLVIMTSNLGSGCYGDRRGTGFGDPDASVAERDLMHRVLAEAKRSFPPELWNRIDEKFVFERLSPEEVAAVGRLLLERSVRRLRRERDIGFVWDESVVGHLLENGGYVPELGARPMRRAVERHVEDAIADGIIRGEFVPGDALSVSVREGRVTVEKRP